MDNVIEQLRELRAKGINQTTIRGSIPNISLTNDPEEWRGFCLFLGTALLVFLISGIVLAWMHEQNAWSNAAFAGVSIGLLVAVLYYLLPILKILGFTLWHQRRPPRHVLTDFSGGQKFVCIALIALGLLYAFNHIVPMIHYTLRHHHWPRHWVSIHPFVTIWWHLGIIWLGIMLTLAYWLPFLLPKESNSSQNRFKGSVRDDSASGSTLPFGLWLGCSTGLLSGLWHRAGLASNLEIVLTTEDAAQNILVLGGIGAGKTTRLMQPLLAQLLDQKCGGLLFDVKGDVKKAVILLAEMTNHQTTLIGPMKSPPRF